MCYSVAELRHRFHEHGLASHQGLGGPHAARDQGGLRHSTREAANVPAESRRVQRETHLRGVLRQEGILLRQAARHGGRHRHLHVGDAVVVGALRAAAARRRQGALLRRAQEVPRLPQRAGGARGRGRARVPRHHGPPAARGDGNTQVRHFTI